ncbi:Tat proofreading chaperone DmsD [Atlantibacter subterranea]|uniref:Tat proofreading chaperone DmsD n=1 Tax=Atlantibacter subterraneus TaxID=255519 RepID=A0A427V224_9ENTR|nr:Tat proofreading chaperone DmsD [Atlantibacter subterranea]MDA3133300.1 Tat proofreading chaperone DmsD [Atlantibacter subterranea]RSB62532.1 Tat proofreading chaperone DmsD [Atlantibacter subterranea]RSE03480.1 Tat proofreading chaperone DmsD [Atlantibacter subterranea]RSE26816.1 Tat proofreading chaperone DmsD [Atlantibacter subterranea]
MKADLAHWAQLLNLLASAYRTAPQSDAFTPIGEFFQTPDWPELWPTQRADIAALQPELAQRDRALLQQQWQWLFIGPASLPAPPWGSVWLDPEHVLQGDSTLRLKDFLNQQRITLNTDHPEPADHIGLMLFQASWLAMANQPRALLELLSQHFLTWLPLYQQALNNAHPQGFYRALGELTLITLRQLHQALNDGQPERIL